MIDLFGNNGRKTFRAVCVWGMESHKATDPQTAEFSTVDTAELSTVDWTKYVKGNYVNLQRVKAKFMSYNPVTNTVYLEEL